jgi:lipopolysaccharide transport system permease protein
VSPVSEPVRAASALQVTRYEADARPWAVPVWRHLARLWRFRHLLLSWTERDLRIKYKQTVLGVAWAVLQPLVMMAVLSVVFAWFYRVPSDGIPYPLFSYAGLLPWTFFATSLTLASLSLASNMQLVTKVYFPREILPLAAVAGCFVDFLIAGGVFVGMMAWYGVGFTWRLLLVPLLLAVQILLTAALAMLVAGLCVFYRDVKYALPFGLQVWMFATPVVYPLSAIPERYQAAYLMLNPMAGIVEGYRRLILWREVPDLWPVWLAMAVALALFLLIYPRFKRWEEQFPDLY